MNTMIVDDVHSNADAVAPAATDIAPYAFEASSLLKVLGHEGRLLILCHLKDGEKTVSELTQLMGTTQPIVSSHLARLRYEELVSFRRVGKTSVYSLETEKARQLLQLVNTLFCAGLRDHLGG